MKNSILKILLSSLVTASLAFAETVPEVSVPSTFEAQQIPDDVEKVFFSRLIDGKPMLLPQPVQKLPAEIKVSDVWSGNRPYMKASVDKVNLKFNKVEEGEKTGGTFDFDFEFAPDAFVIRHSNPQYPSERAGFRVGNDRMQKARKFFIRGKNKQSLAMFVPAYAPSEKSRGVLLCPRDFFSVGTREEKASLQSSGYVLNYASGEAKAEMNAYLKHPIVFVLAACLGAWLWPPSAESLPNRMRSSGR